MCPNCNTEIRELDQNFCGVCAADVRGLQARCACGFGVHEGLLEDNPNYCTQCGAGWKDAIPPAAA